MSDDDAARVRMTDAVIEDALSGVYFDLEALGSTPKTRELHARAENYRRAFAQWASSPPSDAQRRALGDLVLELHGNVRELRREEDMALTPVVGIPAMRMPSRPPPSKK